MNDEDWRETECHEAYSDKVESFLSVNRSTFVHLIPLELLCNLDCSVLKPQLYTSYSMYSGNTTLKGIIWAWEITVLATFGFREQMRGLYRIRKNLVLHTLIA